MQAPQKDDREDRKQASERAYTTEKEDDENSTQKKEAKRKKYQKILAKVSPVAACVRIDIKKHERGFDMVT